MLHREKMLVAGVLLNSVVYTVSVPCTITITIVLKTVIHSCENSTKRVTYVL